MLLVPSRGWSVALVGVTDTAEFGLLGPFFRGQFLVTLTVGIRCSGNNVVTFGAVMTESNRAALDVWSSGSPVIQRSALAEDGQPVVATGLGNNNWKITELAMGRRIEEAPMYMVVRVLGGGAAVLVDAWFSVSCVELLRGEAGNGTV